MRGKESRVENFDKIKMIKNESTVIEFMHLNKISWYISLPDDQLSWGNELLKNIAFRCDDYKVYKF
jgi:hypothetical protein